MPERRAVEEKERRLAVALLPGGAQARVRGRVVDALADVDVPLLAPDRELEAQQRVVVGAGAPAAEVQAVQAARGSPQRRLVEEQVPGRAAPALRGAAGKVVVGEAQRLGDQQDRGPDRLTVELRQPDERA